MPTRHLNFVLVLALMLTPAAILAAKKKSTTTPTPAPTPARADTVTPAPVTLTPVTVSVLPMTMSRTPGPTITPGSPIEDRTTIAPFPIPGDTSRAASERAKALNVPREGVTTLVPLPPGVAPQPMDVFPRAYMPPVPEYPKAARDARIQGTVMVMAHVRIDGTVDDARVVKSIPALDDAAVKAVKRMRFTPAFYRDRAVSAWVGVPVRFTLH